MDCGCVDLLEHKMIAIKTVQLHIARLEMCAPKVAGSVSPYVFTEHQEENGNEGLMVCLGKERGAHPGRGRLPGGVRP